MQKLHPTQQALLEILEKNSGETLSVRDLQDRVNVSSPSIIQHHIAQLEKKGYLRRNPANPSDYQVLIEAPDKDIAYINVYGMAQCGPKGSILDGNPIERIRISSKVLGFSAPDAFIVKAKGNSMMPKINQGDLVIAKKTPIANSGETIVCVNNGEALIKKLQIIDTKSGEKSYNLVSFNEKYPSFVASDDFRIEGVVKGVLSYTM